ncbi:MAG: hypothetical protein QOG67_15 [Verrucomicrobiota bacterium]
MQLIADEHTTEVIVISYSLFGADSEPPAVTDPVLVRPKEHV